MIARRLRRGMAPTLETRSVGMAASVQSSTSVTGNRRNAMLLTLKSAKTRSAIMRLT